MSRSRVATARPANQTPISANDVVLGAVNFQLISGRDVIVTSADLLINTTGIPTGMTSFRLYLYDVTPPSALADNAAWDLPSGDQASFLGYIDLGSPIDLGSTLFVQTDQVNKQIRLQDTNLYGYLVTNGGYTPAANSEVYTLTIHTVPVQ